ncbi:MAG: leucine-rich repeat domain-containing protein [Oscillatoriales cyanobacterium]|nr:MAG: leucine-rich repeat domain-containing protein [Oscillatoriales cyanobacterium]
MSEKQPNEPISFSRFADWCRHIDSLSEGAKHTVEVLLEKAGTDDAEAAEQILSSMTTLNLSSNRITDISFLGSLTNLTTLYLGDNQITDISFLRSLTNLTTLYLDNNQITDISFLGSLTNLTTLDLDSNQITDISFLGSLTNLTALDLKGNKIRDISFLGSLTNLTTLDLGDNKISDISFLGSLTNLTTLDLDSNRITDISLLGSLTNLTALNLENNQITDISALRSLTNQTTLNLDNNEITVLCVLGELAQKRLTLSTTPIDAQKATAAIKVAYAAIGLEEPEVIICSSLRDVCPQIFNRLKPDHSQKCSDEYSNRLGKNLDLKWIPAVGEFASSDLWEYELDHMVIEPEADSTLSSVMYKLVDSYVRSKQTIWNVFSNNLFGFNCPETPTTLFKEIYLTELYISSGVNISQKAQEILRCQKLLFEHCGFIFPFEKICAVCDRPRHLRFDSENRLHAEAEPAIEFADGWNFYYYHGVRLPEQYGQVHPNLWKAEWLLSEDNAEVRRVLIEAIGYDRICQELAAEQIDTWQEYALLKIDNADVEPIYLLKMTCPSTEFIHALRVPPNVTSAREAIRWVNGGIDPEEFSVQT